MAKPSKALEKLQLEMKNTLEALKCLEVVSTSSRGKDIRFLFRVLDENIWLQILNSYLAQEGDWYSFVGKKYFSNEGNLVFGWVMILESDDLDKTVTDVRRILLTVNDEIARPPQTASGDDPGFIEVPLPFNAGYGDRL